MKIIFKTLTLVVSLLSFLIADENEKNSVNGSVVSGSQGIPLQGANVELIGGNNQQYGATTDKIGGFNIENIEDGNYKISVSFIGFEDFKKDALAEGISFTVCA